MDQFIMLNCFSWKRTEDAWMCRQHGKYRSSKIYPKTHGHALLANILNDGAGTTWKESQAFAKELNDLDESSAWNKEHRRWLFSVQDHPFPVLWKRLPIYSGELILHCLQKFLAATVFIHYMANNGQSLLICFNKAVAVNGSMGCSQK